MNESIFKYLMRDNNAMMMITGMAIPRMVIRWPRSNKSNAMMTMVMIWRIYNEDNDDNDNFTDDNIKW